MSTLITPPTEGAHPFTRMRAAALAAGVGLSLAIAPLAQAQTAAPAVSPHSAANLPSFAPLVQKVMPAVVNISVTEKSAAPGDEDEGQDQLGPDQDQGPVPGFPPSPFDQFLKRFFQDQGGMGAPSAHVKRVALGSGFIIDPSGYVVTNNHVVQNADKVTVIFQDNTRHPAKVIGRDPKTDLALLKINVGHPLPYVQWGDSTAAHVGDWVLAVGNPFGLGGTVSSGIISARGRDIHAGPYDDFLQIDASINRGNSGGPTFNLQGQVIGINTAIYSPNGGSVGIGFAIPSSLAKPVIEQIKEHGKVERGWLGVQIQEVTPEIAKSLGLPKAEGALVADVTKGSPAAKAGFKQGDVILAFDGHHIAKVRDLPIIVAETSVGEKAQVKVWRKEHDVTLQPEIGEMPANPQVAQNEETGEAQHASTMGLKLAPLTEEWRHRLHLSKSVQGVVVTAVADNSPLAELGLQPGDVIESIDQERVTTPKQAVEKLKKAEDEKGNRKNLLVLLNRHGVNQYIALSVENNTGNKG
jgi:serine protease Do